MEVLQPIVSWLSLGWVGSLLGIAGLVAAFLTYKWTRQRSIIAYKNGGIRLIGGSKSQLPTDVTVLYRGQTIPGLSRSIVVLWNEGEKSIAGTDLSTIDRLRLEVSQECEILSAQVVGVSRSVIQFSCTLSNPPNRADFGFEFLDRHDGAIVEVLHTSQPDGLVVVGTVRGIPSGPRSLGSANALPPKVVKSLRRYAFATGAAGIIGILGALFAPLEWLAWPFTMEAIVETPLLKVMIRAPVVLLTTFLVLPAIVLGLSWLRGRYPESLSRLAYWDEKAEKAPDQIQA